jgi:hypothetical protein
MAATPDIIKLITDWVGSNVGALTVGTNLFARELTDKDPDTSVMFKGTGAGQDIQQRDFEDFTMQVISRAADLPTAESNSLLVFDFLHRNKKSLHDLPEGDTAQIEVMQCWALQRPFELPSDGKHRAIYSNNYFFKILKP